MRKYFLLCLFHAAIITSCNTTQSSADSPQCTAQALTETISLNIAGLTLSTDVWVASDDPNYRFGQTNIKNTADFNKIVSYLNIPVQEQTTPVSVTLYSDQFYTGDQTSFVPGTLQGFSYYYYANNVLRHALFLRQEDNSFKTSIPQLNCAAAGLDFGNMHRIVKLFFRNHFDTVSAIAFNAVNLFKEPGEDKINDLGNQLKKMEVAVKTP
jgi:hypothetical protein